MTPINPPDEFLKHAAECQQMAKTTRNPARRRGTGWPKDGFNALKEPKAKALRHAPACPYGGNPSLLRLFIEPDWVLLLLFQPRCGGAFSLGARRKRRKLRGSNRATPWRESMALDRSKRPPRERARQAIFLGETEPRATRPLGASPRGSVSRLSWRANVNRTPHHR
jgi:hypothetical protein